MATNPALELSIRIAGKIDPSLAKTFSTASKQVSSFSQGLSTVAKVTIGAVTGAATAIAVGIDKCTESAAANRNSLADVVKYVDGLADEDGLISDKMYENGKTYAENYAYVAENLKVLSTQIPLTKDELSQLTAAAGQSGKQLEELFEIDANGNVQGFVRDAAMMAAAWDIDALTAGDYAAKWENIMSIRDDATGEWHKMNHDDVMVLANQINYLAANTATTAAEVAGVVNDVVGMGQIVGMEPASVAALADSLLAMGVESSTAATSIRRMFTNMAMGDKATAAQKKAWEELGFTASGVAKSMQEDSEGTMLSVFRALDTLDTDKRAGMIKTLFGVYSEESAAKLAMNTDDLVEALEMVQDFDSYDGSMQREFIIKSSTPEAVDLMTANARDNLMVDIGEAFLPIKQELGLMKIDLFENIRASLPEISKLANSALPLIRAGMEGVGTALEKAMPYAQKLIDYLLNNGQKVASTLAAIGTVLAGMLFAPQIEGIFRGAAGFLFGGTSSGAGRSGGGLAGGIGRIFSGGASGGTALLNMAGAAVLGKAETGSAKVLGGVANSLLNGMAAGLLIPQKGLLGGITRKVLGIGLGTLFPLGETTQPKGPYATSLVNTLMGGYASIQEAKPASKLETILMGARQGRAMMGTGGGLTGALTAVQNLGGLNSGRKSTRMTAYDNYAGQLLDGLNLRTETAATASRIFGNGFIGRKISGLAGAAAPALNAAKGAFLQTRFGGYLGNVGRAVSTAFNPTAQMSGMDAVLNLVKVPGTIFGPIAKGGLGMFSNLMGMFGPAIMKVGTLAAVVSMLGDHFEDVRGLVKAVFGESGLAVFDQFTGKVKGIGDAIKGTFQQLQTPEGIQNIQQQLSGISIGGLNLGDVFTAALPAIQTVMPLVQSFVGVFSQIVDLGVNHIKPVLTEIFGFIINEGIPAVMPLLSTVVSLVGTTLVNAIKVVMDVVGMVLPVVEPVILGIIDLAKSIVSVVVNVVNGIIGALNKIQITVPDWSPVFAGKTFGFNLQEVALPEYATGGFTHGVSIAGEAGTEAVISFDPSVRSQNVATWMQAGQMLGVRQFANGGFTDGRSTMEDTGKLILFRSATSLLANAGRALFSSDPAVAMQDLVGTGLRRTAYELANFASDSLTLRELTGGSQAPIYLQDFLPRSAGEEVVLRDWPGADNDPPRGGYPGGAGGGRPVQYVFAPQLTIYGNADRAEISETMDAEYEKFKRNVERFERERRSTQYA